ncbi:Uncharacterized protein FWK35_00031749 [Aphis craccivora]|uniref:ELKS/Rab6-interacting/CAST family member 1-like n=1 Tax=Aphis craccivora TaxID=307492 RepID=A0A6G0VPQ2_APHCR|nr:Uncharacterized protein FWK35_00031749 [Aphis craccivora]
MGRPSKRTQNKKEAIKISRENIVLHLQELEKDKLRKQLHPVLKKANQIASHKSVLKRLQDQVIKNANKVASVKNRLKRILRFPSSVNKCNSDIFNRLGMSIPSDAKSTVTICTSCLPHIKKSKVPPLYIANGYELNSVPSSVTQLNQIEKQMVSLRLPLELP